MHVATSTLSTFFSKTLSMGNLTSATATIMEPKHTTTAAQSLQAVLDRHNDALSRTRPRSPRSKAPDARSDSACSSHLALISSNADFPLIGSTTSHCVQRRSTEKLFEHESEPGSLDPSTPNAPNHMQPSEVDHNSSKALNEREDYVRSSSTSVHDNRTATDVGKADAQPQCSRRRTWWVFSTEGVSQTLTRAGHILLGSAHSMMESK